MKTITEVRLNLLATCASRISTLRIFTAIGRTTRQATLCAKLRTLLPLLCLLAATGQSLAFYNPQTGRWLTRDPIGEQGGGNLHAFAENRPTIRVDVDGRMVLLEVFRELPQRPPKGPYTAYDGLTWFNSFEPKAQVRQGADGPCCWKIIIPGYAMLFYWWVKDAPGLGGIGTAKDHELEHVAVHRESYNGFNASASDYVGHCFSKAKAECWKTVINGPLLAAWLDHNHTKNLLIDASYRGNEIPTAMQAEAASWGKLAKEEDKCASME